MGITDAYDVCDFFLYNSEVENNKFKPKLKCNVYIDGYVLWFSGKMRNQSNDGYVYDPDVVNANIRDIYQYIENSGNFEIQSKRIVLDGKPPALKASGNAGRVRDEIVPWIQQVRNDGELGEIVELGENGGRGEAEIQCFLERDTSVASIICTSDSDMLHICYNFPERSDRVFLFRLKYQHPVKKILYDANLFTTNNNNNNDNFNLNKNAFTLILYLLEDKNCIESLFTQTMVKKLFQLLNVRSYTEVFHRINIKMNELSIDNIKKCITCFIWLLFDDIKNVTSEGRRNIRVHFPNNNTRMERRNYIEVLHWMIMYSNQGKNIENYENFQPQWLNDFEIFTKLQYIFDICYLIFPRNDACQALDYKERIKNLMNNIPIEDIIKMMN